MEKDAELGAQGMCRMKKETQDVLAERTAQEKTRYKVRS